MKRNLLENIDRMKVLAGLTLKENEQREITCIVPNWKEFAKEFTEYATSEPANFRNPMKIWKDLNAKVAEHFEMFGEYPEMMLVSYGHDHRSGDCIFQFKADTATQKSPSYEYTGTVGAL